MTFTKPTTEAEIDAVTQERARIKANPMKLNVSTNQEAFNKVVRYLKTLKGRVGVDNGVGFACLYRAPDGRACAAGILLPDECRAFNFGPDNTADRVVREYVQPTDVSGELLNSLQTAHDDGRNWRDDKFVATDSLFAIAAQWNLDRSVITETLLETRVAQWTEAVKHAEKLRIERDAAKETFDRLRRATEDADNAAFYAERWAKYALRDMMNDELDKSGIIVRDLA